MSDLNKRQWLALVLWTLAWLTPAIPFFGYAAYRNSAEFAQQEQQARERADEFHAAYLRKHANHDSPNRRWP
jgi:hypothetical protein